MPHLCDFLVDIGFNSVFPIEELDREKEVMFNEIARDADDDYLVTKRTLWSCLWQHNPLQEFGVGSPDGIRAVLRDDLSCFSTTRMVQTVQHACYCNGEH